MAAVTSYENALLSYQKFDSFPATHRWHKDHEVYPADFTKIQCKLHVNAHDSAVLLISGDREGAFSVVNKLEKTYWTYGTTRRKLVFATHC